ncbi:MAG TPA: ComEC/Rec2 family competence protein [Candidatus Paceibacterota bacterium]|nr:ComEC/Rec2 family competence protein [Candidatus Paceibacterota bacterium]
MFLFVHDRRDSDRGLVFAMLDVGQGDALYIESPTGTQVLVDGGPLRKILGKLSEVMPSYDRKIDALIMTHSDSDHISGFSEVLSAYEVGQMFEPGVATDSLIYENLKKELEEKKIPSVIARKGMRLHLGGGAVIDIIFPDRDVYDWETNMASLVLKLTYGDVSFMLTGDALIETEELILKETPAEFLKSTYLKAGHHGSKTSTSQKFAEAVSPEYALISAGRENNYGHPHPEVLEILKSIGAQILRTDHSGTLWIKCKGTPYPNMQGDPLHVIHRFL